MDNYTAIRNFGDRRQGGFRTSVMKRKGKEKLFIVKVIKGKPIWVGKGDLKLSVLRSFFDKISLVCKPTNLTKEKILL